MMINTLKLYKRLEKDAQEKLDARAYLDGDLCKVTRDDSDFCCTWYRILAQKVRSTVKVVNPLTPILHSFTS
jgi:hypothetical protein